MSDHTDRGLQTTVLHEWDTLNRTDAVTAPIWQTSTFKAASAIDLGERGESIQPAEFYTRYGNPSHQHVAATVAALEGGEAAHVASSGMGAIFCAIMAVVQQGDHVVAQQNHYAATTKLFRDLFPRWGIERTLVDQCNPAEFAAAIQPNTKLIYIETPCNPLLDLTDIAAIAELAKSRGIMTMIDNTFATPVNQKPLALGIDVVVHSATKYLGGHHDLMAGVIVGSQSFIETVWDFSLVSGAILSPFDAWLLLRGMKTLGIRVERQNTNAMALANFLERNSAVERVNYPGLPSHPQHALAKKQMTGYGGMMSVEMRGNFDTAARFVDRLKLAKCAVSLGGVETLVTHAAAMWGHQHSEEQRRALRISDTLVRISVGVEDERDLIDDFAQALEL